MSNAISCLLICRETARVLCLFRWRSEVKVVSTTGNAPTVRWKETGAGRRRLPGVQLFSSPLTLSEIVARGFTIIG
jgi:hypothetical protein